MFQAESGSYAMPEACIFIDLCNQKLINNFILTFGKNKINFRILEGIIVKRELYEIIRRFGFILHHFTMSQADNKKKGEH